ncbi:MAG: hypothetical protein WC340_09765 [Kiritimatiellia bacterium]
MPLIERLLHSMLADDGGLRFKTPRLKKSSTTTTNNNNNNIVAAIVNRRRSRLPRPARI